MAAPTEVGAATVLYRTTRSSRSRWLGGVLAIVVPLGLVACSGDDGGASDANKELWEQATRAIDECMDEAGFESPSGEFTEEAIAAGNPEYDALRQCEDDVFFRPEFEALDLDYEVESYDEWVADSWRIWICLEEEGYTRVTPIPLMFEGGRPIRPIITNFGIDPENESAVEDFYVTAAGCGDGDIDGYKFDGRWLGTTEGEIIGCGDENRGQPGFDDKTGCFNVDEYPADL